MKYLGVLLLLFIGGCATHHNVNIAPIEVAPIRVTMDVNVNVHESDVPVGGDAADDTADDEAETAGGDDSSDPAHER